MFPVVALDLDGTLLRSDGSVSERTLRVLDRYLLLGGRIVLATARPPRTVPQLALSSRYSIPWICYNGAETYEAGGRVLTYHLSPDTAREIVRIVNASAPGSVVAAEIDDWHYCDRVTTNPWPHDVVDLIGFIDRPVAKVLFDCTCIEDPAPIARSLPTDCVCKFTTGRTLGEVMSAHATKAAGLAALLARWSMSFADVIAFGDDTPDIEMIRACGMGVAMANAVPEVRSAADRLTLSNDEDGVAVVLEEMIGTWNRR